VYLLVGVNPDTNFAQKQWALSAAWFTTAFICPELAEQITIYAP
jgi:hypothetical protein